MLVEETPTRILRDELGVRTQKNPAYSLRAFARDLGMSHTYLSLVMNGKKALSLKQAYKIAGIMGLPPHELPLLLGSVSNIKKANKRKNRQSVQLENDRFQFVSQWYHVAILDLTLLRGFRSDIHWIARSLQISPLQAGRAIARLERMELLKSENGKWVKASEDVFVPGSTPVPAIRKFHEQMIQKALKALKAKDEVGFKKRDITGTTMAIDPTLLPIAQKKIQRFRKDLMRFLSQGDKTALFQLNVQLFELGGVA